MRTIHTEFPDFDREVNLPEGFEDTSWHNDACPSFYCLNTGRTIFIDYANCDLRDCPDMPAFAVITHGNESEEAVTHYWGDDYNEALRVVMEKGQS